VIERRTREIELVEARYGGLDLAADRSWLIIHAFPLPAGWNKTETDVLIIISPGYPQTPPDNFYTELDLRLANGAQAEGGSDGPVYEGHQWQQFSWHFVDAADWEPRAEIEQGHNLLTFLDGVEQRLSELS
jgi:hypothetical protein